MSTIHSPSWSKLITSDCSSIPIAFRQFFTCTVLCNVHLHFSLMLVRKTNAVEEATKWFVWLYNQHNQSIHMTDGMAMMSLSASLLQKISAATDRLCQITLKGKLLCKFKEWYKFSSNIKVKLRKKKSHKTRPTCRRKSWYLRAVNFCGVIIG
jgi:hypothetical protein